MTRRVGGRQQQNLIAQWFEQLGEERDRKLDAYAALTEMTARAAMRKAELVCKNWLLVMRTGKTSQDRLKWFFETHGLKTIETPRYKLQLAKNGGKAPLILDESVPVAKLPERFQKVSIDPTQWQLERRWNVGNRWSLQCWENALQVCA